MNTTITKPKWTVAKTAVVTSLTVAAFMGTMFIRIPIPATTGYFNLGDVFVMLAGLWLGPLAGLLVGAVGPAAADAVGYPQFIFATAVTKGLEGFLVGVIGHKSRSMIRPVVAVAIGALTIVLGYFVFEAYVYPRIGTTIPFFDVTTFQAAVVEMIPNAGQGLIAAILALGLYKAVNFGQARNQMTEDAEEPSSENSPEEN